MYIYNPDGEVIFASDEILLTYGPRAAAAMPLGKLVVGPEWTQFALQFNRGEIRDIRALFVVHGSHLLYQLNGDKARQGERWRLKSVISSTRWNHWRYWP